MSIVSPSHPGTGSTTPAVAPTTLTYRLEASSVRLRAFGRPRTSGSRCSPGFAQNRYVAPMLLGEPWERLDAFHGTSMAEPEWADDVVQAQAHFWQRQGLADNGGLLAALRSRRRPSEHGQVN
jgi:hypothetical protein